MPAEEEDIKLDCEEFKGFIWSSGYGCIKRNGKSQRAHKYFYEQQFGKVPEGMVLDHLCRNRKCINLEHLQVVSIADNTRRGNSAKLNFDIVEKIKSFHSLGKNQTYLARLFKVNQSTISRILNNKRWT